ncbi:MAG TPA: hypothetical protein VHL85_12345 [Burkholderiales bacterium]|jgi:PleD family two-component response regulator|nr:hypothetical protein [Burkholderiales bacterium]
MGRTYAAKVLVADVPELEDVFRSCFSPVHDVTYVPSYPEAMDAIAANRYDLIVVGMHFGESRMFDLIRFTRLERRNRTTPVVAVCGLPSEFSEDTHRAVEHAVEALGGNGFVQFTLERDSLTAACRAIERHLPTHAASSSPL